MHNVGELSNEALLAGVGPKLASEHAALAASIAYLGEIDARRLYLEVACASMWNYCVERLGLSESEAQRRITVARLARTYPRVLDYLERRDVHLCALVALRGYLTPENHEELLAAAARKTVQQVHQMLAARFPRPDVVARIEHVDPQPLLSNAVPAGASASPSYPRTSPIASKVEPLSATRFALHVSISSETKRELDEALDLLRHCDPTGDLQAFVEKAIKERAAAVRKSRLAETTRPPKKKRSEARASPSPKKAESAKKDRRAIPRPVRRFVFERDGRQCTYRDERGNRCSCRALLQIDHIVPLACGGTDAPDNLRVLCRAHNRLAAEKAFGRAHVENKIHERQRKNDEEGAARTVFDAATCGLKDLGFRDADVKRALAAIGRDVEPGKIDVELVVRKALAILT